MVGQIGDVGPTQCNAVALRDLLGPYFKPHSAMGRSAVLWGLGR